MATSSHHVLSIFWYDLSNFVLLDKMSTKVYLRTLDNLS